MTKDEFKKIAEALLESLNLYDAEACGKIETDHDEDIEFVVQVFNAVAEEARREALEEGAKIADEYITPISNTKTLVGGEIAKAIRAEIGRNK